MIKMNLQLFGGRSSAGGNAKASATRAAEPKATTSITGGFKLNTNIKKKLDELNSKAKELGVTDRELVVGYAPESGDRATLFVRYSDGTIGKRPIGYINSISKNSEPWVVVDDKTKRTTNSALNAMFPVDKRFGKR